MSGVQLDLFDFFASPQPPVSAVVLREEARFGKWDARTGFSLRNHYSNRITGERLVAYETAFREERAQQASA